MSTARTAPRSNAMNKSTSYHTQHTNGSANTYETIDSPSNNASEFESNVQRPSAMKNNPQHEGIYRNPRFIHTVTTGLMGQQVVLQTSEAEKYHGVLGTISPNGDVILTVAHRLDNNNNHDIINVPTSPLDLSDTIDNSLATFELQRRTILASNIVEIIAVDVDITNQGKCLLDETQKVTQLEDERFNRMEHFYGGEEFDSEALEELDRGNDGKAGYDPEEMFDTNREKFNTTTDFDESKYTNVPVRVRTASEQAEIERKALEIEKGATYEDVDEDDAGVKRPADFNQASHTDDGNSNVKANSSKRGNWPDQKSRNNTGNIRRGGANNYSMNNSKQNQRSQQTQYGTSRSSEHSTGNRPFQYNAHNTRSNRYNENRSPHEGQNSPSQTTPDEPTRGQRINSGSFSQGPNSGSTSPSTAGPGRTIYSNTRQPIGRNSPAPYTGGSSSRNNSITATSPPPQSVNSYQTASGGPGNYSQSAPNRVNKKQSRGESQYSNDEVDQPKQQQQQQHQPQPQSQQQQPQPPPPPSQQQQQQQQRNQSQASVAPSSTSNNSSNIVPLNRPSQLHTQQMKQHHSTTTPSSNIPSLPHPTQDDHSSSHEPISLNQTDPSHHMNNQPVYAQQVAHPAGMTTSISNKPDSDLNPEADEFVPVSTRDSGPRPDPSSTSVNPMSMNSNTYIPHTHPQQLHLMPQQHQQQQPQQPPMIPTTHGQNAGPMYQPYYPSPFASMPQFVNTVQQPMNVGMMGTSMIAQPQLSGNGPNSTNANGMTASNGGNAPMYKTNNNLAHGADAGNTGVNNMGSKKAVVSVRGEQSNISQQQQQQQPPQQQQQQQTPGAPPIIFPNQSVRFYSSEYMAQQAAPPSMQLPPMPFYCQMNSSNLIQASGVGPPQNIMVPSATSSTGPIPPTQTSYYFPGMYTDPRMYSMYQPTTPVNPNNVNSNWHLPRSPPHQQSQPQVADTQRAYASAGQNLVAQMPQQTNVPNTAGIGGRSTSTSGPSGQSGANGPPMTPQYAFNGNVQPSYPYGSANTWLTGSQPISSPQTSMAPPVNTFAMIFDPPQQQALQPPPTYVHPNLYEPAYFQQVQQQQAPQQGLDVVPPGNYNR